MVFTVVYYHLQPGATYMESCAAKSVPNQLYYVYINIASLYFASCHSSYPGSIVVVLGKSWVWEQDHIVLQ